jgi:hypothetical protein
MIPNIPQRRIARTPGAILAFAAIASLALALAQAESPIAKGEQTGGVIPEEYRNQPQAKTSAEPDAATSVRSNGSAAGMAVSTSAHRGSNENAVASNGKGGVIVGWQDSGTSQCCYAYSADNGVTWNHRCVKPLGPGGGHAGDATAGAGPDGALYAVCQDYSVSQVRISHTKDNGKTWSDWKSVQSSPDKPWVGAGKGGMVYISWLGNGAGWKRSQDYGETWDAVKTIGFINHGTTFGVGGKYVHVLFNQGDGLAYQRSVDFGATAEPRKVLVQDQGTFCYSPCNPRMHPIVGGGSDSTGKNVVAVWTSRMGNDADDNVYAVISRDFGATWTQPIRVNTTTAGRQIQAWAGADSHGRIHVAWTDLSRGNTQVAVMYASTLNNVFTNEVELTDQRSGISGFFGDYKGLWIDNNDVLVTWMDSRTGSAQIYFNRGKNLAAGTGTAVVPGTPGYRREAVWKQSIPSFDVAGRKVRSTKAGASKATGKYLAKPEKAGKTDGK